MSTSATLKSFCLKFIPMVYTCEHVTLNPTLTKYFTINRAVILIFKTNSTEIILGLFIIVFLEVCERIYVRISWRSQLSASSLLPLSSWRSTSDDTVCCREVGLAPGAALDSSMAHRPDKGLLLPLPLCASGRRARQADVIGTSCSRLAGRRHVLFTSCARRREEVQERVTDVWLDSQSVRFWSFFLNYFLTNIYISHVSEAKTDCKIVESNKWRDKRNTQDILSFSVDYGYPLTHPLPTGGNPG